MPQGKHEQTFANLFEKYCQNSKKSILKIINVIICVLPLRLYSAVLRGQQRGMGQLPHQPQRTILPAREHEMWYLVQVYPDCAERRGPRPHQ